MKVMSQNQLLDANDYFSEYMSRLEYSGSEDYEAESARIAKEALLRFTPYLVGRQGKPVQVEAFRCEGVSLEGVTPFEEVAYRGMLRATLGVKQTDTDTSTGLTLSRYGFMVRVEPEFDRATDPAIKDCAFTVADFTAVDRIIIPS